MAGAKEIRTKIASIKSTQKITSAMEMVAAAKMRRAQDRMSASRPYSEKMLQVIGHLYHATPEYRHSFLATERERKRIGYIVVSSDRGLCRHFAPSAPRRWASLNASVATSWHKSASWVISPTSRI